MNRKVMRKSTLISSIAMLLVAVLALSGVTFAWFSAEPVATAGTLALSSTAINGVYLSETTLSAAEAGDWGTNLNWTDDSKTLAPVSCAFVDGTTNFYATTSNAPSGAWDGETEITNAGADSYIAKKVWIKADVTTAEDVEKPDLMLSFNWGGLMKRNYTRVVFVDKNGNAIVFAPEAREYEAFVNSTGETADMTAVAGTTTGTALIENYDGTETYFYVYFFFEGQDGDCKTSNSYANITMDLTFTLGE